MKRVLVTGAQGFLGRYLVAALLKDGDVEVLGCGRSPGLTGSFTHRIRIEGRLVPAPLPQGMETSTAAGHYRYVQADVLDVVRMEQCLRQFQPDTIFHLASTLRDEAVDALFRTNVLGTAGLMEAIGASEAAVRRVIVGSSAAVYGHPRELPLSEDANCSPADPYGASKLSAEHLSRIMGAQLAIPCIWARLFNLVGPGQDERHLCGRLVSQMAAIVRSDAPPVVRAGNLDPTRDYIDVRDAAQALVEIDGKGSPNSVYNVASGIETPVRDVLDACLKVAGLGGNVSVEAMSGRPDDIARHFGDVRRLAALGFRRRYTLQDSLKGLFVYYLRA